MDAADTEPSPWLLLKSVDVCQTYLYEVLVRCLSYVTTKKSSRQVWNKDNKPGWWDTEFLEALEQVKPEVKDTKSWKYYKSDKALTWKNPTAKTEDSLAILKVRIGLLLKHLKTEEPDDERERRQIKILTHVWEKDNPRQLKMCCTFLGALAHTEIATKLLSNTDPEIARQAEQFLEESRRCFEDSFGALVNQGQTSSQPLDSALTLRKHVALDQARHTPPSEYKDRDIRRSQRSDANCKNSNIPVTTDARESPTHYPCQPEQPESDHSLSDSVGQIVDKGKQLGAPSATTPGEPEAEPYGSSEVPSADPCLKRMGDTQAEQTDKRRKVDAHLESVSPSFTDSDMDLESADTEEPPMDIRSAYILAGDHSSSRNTTLTTPDQVHQTVVNSRITLPTSHAEDSEYLSALYKQNDGVSQTQRSPGGISFEVKAIEMTWDSDSFHAQPSSPLPKTDLKKYVLGYTAESNLFEAELRKEEEESSSTAFTWPEQPYSEMLGLNFEEELDLDMDSTTLNLLNHPILNSQETADAREFCKLLERKKGAATAAGLVTGLSSPDAAGTSCGISGQQQTENVGTDSNQQCPKHLEENQESGYSSGPSPLNDQETMPNSNSCQAYSPSPLPETTDLEEYLEEEAGDSNLIEAELREEEESSSTEATGSGQPFSEMAGLNFELSDFEQELL